MSVSNKVIDIQPKSANIDIEDLSEAVEDVMIVPNNLLSTDSSFSILRTLDQLDIKAGISGGSCWSRCCSCSSEESTQILHENEKLYSALKKKTCGLFCVQSFDVYDGNNEASIMHLRYSPVGICYCPLETTVAVFSPPRNIIGNIIHNSEIFRDKFQIFNRQGVLICKITPKGFFKKRFEVVLTNEEHPVALATTERGKDGVKINFLRHIPENGKILLLAFGIYLQDILRQKKKQAEASGGVSISNLVEII